MKKILLLIGILACLPASGRAETVPVENIPSVKAQDITATPSNETLTFQSYVKKVLSYYPVLKRQHAKIDEAIAAKYLAVAGIFPKVQGITSVQTGNDPVYVFGTLLKQRAFASGNFELSELNNPNRRTNFNFALDGEVPLFQAFQTFSKIRSSNQIVQSEKNRKEFLAMEASLLAAEAYMKILLAEKISAFVSDVKTKIDADIQQAKDLTEKGMVLGADYYGARVMAGTIYQLKNEADSNRRDIQILLEILMGSAPQGRVKVRGELPPVRSEMVPMEEWLTAAYESRQDLKAMREMIKAGDIEKWREQSSILPHFDAFSRLEVNSHDLTTSGNDYLIGIRGNMDILDPTYFPRIKMSRAKIEELRQEETDLRDGIARSISEAYAAYGTVHSNAPIASGMLGDADQAVSLTERLYQEGKKSIADLIEMRKAHVNSYIQNQQLLFQSELQYAKLLFLSGILTDEKIEEIAKHLNSF